MHMYVLNAIKQERAGPGLEKSMHHSCLSSGNLLFLTQGVECGIQVHARAHCWLLIGNAVAARKLKLHLTHMSV